MRFNWGLVAGPALFLITVLTPAPEGMAALAWPTLGLVFWMAIWWMTQALPLAATALLPFLVLPTTGVLNASDTASQYYSPILFLILGGALIALAIERTGLHRRLALALIGLGGKSATSLLFAFMVSAAILSMIISNTSTTLIMVPMAVAILAAGGVDLKRTEGLAGALVMGIAFASSIGGMGTLVGSPTNAIAAGLINQSLGTEIGFATWALYGLPVVIIGVPIATLILVKVQKVGADTFDVTAARAAMHSSGTWSSAERRLVPLVAMVVALWIFQPLLKPLFPDGAITDGTIAVLGGMLLFILPDGTGRKLLNWDEAERAPWSVILMFGGGLALAQGIGVSGLADWIGVMLAPLSVVPLFILALIIVALVVLITEFASNVAVASGITPVVASLIAVLGVDPILLAMPVAIASSWGFMLPSGTGPNAIAWATGHIDLPRMIKAGLLLDIVGVPLMVCAVWGMAFLLG